MINSKKKGFTIVELVIVIAVVAILAAVLIPTFSSLVRKANISSDTVVAKNLNTALALYDAENDIEDFDDVLEGIKEAGYLIANLNAKASGCFFVWEKDSNQILLVDSKEEYKVLFSAKDGYGDIDESWYFAISDKVVAEQVKTDLSNKVTIKQTVASVKDLKDVLAAGGEVYIDESVVLDSSNLLEFNTDTEIEVNLGKSQLTSNDVLTDKYPIDIKKGTVVINGGIIGAAGSNIDLDGKIYQTPINAAKGTKVTINDTVFNGNDSPIQFEGEATLNNVKVNGGYFYSYANGQVTLNDCEAYCPNDVVIWVTNTIKENGQTSYTGTASLTINGGKYESSYSEGNFATVSVHDGTITINKGEFKSAEGHMFGLIGNTCPVIIINGGTFNGVPFEQLTVEILQGMTTSGTVVTTAEGFKITK